jgi:hypothetical protein
MTRSQRPTQPHRTFLEWGLSVPFTTPALAHARIRPTSRRAIELILPNLAGGKGSYVIDLGGAAGLFTLTVHDRLLIEALGTLPALTPAEVRRVVREVAATGAAGRAVRRSAEAAMDEDRTSSRLVEFAFLNALFSGAQDKPVAWHRLREGDSAFRSYLRGRLAELAPRLGLGGEELLDALEEIAWAAAPVGVPGSPQPSRNEREIGRLAWLAETIKAWQSGQREPLPSAEAVVACAERSLAVARRHHEASRQLLADVPALLAAWRTDAAAVAERLARVDWWLDGWQEACAVWEAVARAERPAQRAAIEQIAGLIPFLAAAGANGPNPIPRTEMNRPRRVRLHEDWRTGLEVAKGIAQSEARMAAAL